MLSTNTKLMILAIDLEALRMADVGRIHGRVMEHLENLLPYMFIDSLHESSPDPASRWITTGKTTGTLAGNPASPNQQSYPWIAATWFCGCFMQQSTEEASMKKSF